MRILMTAHTFYPEGTGGVEKHILTLGHYLRGRGHEVAVFYRVGLAGKKEYTLLEGEWEGIPTFKVVRNFVPSGPNPFPYYNRRVEERFVEAVERFRPDLVHVHHLGSLSISIVGATHRLSLPVVWTVHDYWPMCPRSYLLTADGQLCPGPDGGARCVECVWRDVRRTRRPVGLKARLRELGFRRGIRRLPHLLRRAVAVRLRLRDPVWDSLLALPARDIHMRQVMLEADVLVSPSRFLISRFDAWGVPQSRFRHIPNGMPDTLVKRPVERPRREGQPFTFGFIGTLLPHKGAHVLVDAFAQARIPDAVLRMWGGCPAPELHRNYLAALRQKADQHGGITLEGKFPPEQLPEIMGQIDVLVMPSLWYENNPLVLLEATAMKVPVIAADIGGMAELVEHEVNGLLFRAGDVADLAERMRQIAEPGRLEQYRARIRPPRTISETGAELERIYRDLVEG